MTKGDREMRGTANARAWHRSRAIRLTLAVHAMGALVLAVQPGLWAWVATALAANHLVLTLAVFWPRGNFLGPNLSRLSRADGDEGRVVLTFDDGPDPDVTPQVLDLLDRYRMKASFFCIGERAAAFPEIVKEIARRGHSVENHSHAHAHAFAFYGIGRLAREVDAAQAIIAAHAGRAPAFFRAPAGFRSPLLDPVLAMRGLHYASWTRRCYDTVCRDPRVALERLTRGLAAGDILLLHDGGYARTPEGEPMVLAILPSLLDRLARQGLRSVALPDGLATSDLACERAAVDGSALS